MSDGIPEFAVRITSVAQNLRVDFWKRGVVRRIAEIPRARATASAPGGFGELAIPSLHPRVAITLHWDDDQDHAMTFALRFGGGEERYALWHEYWDSSDAVIVAGDVAAAGGARISEFLAGELGAPKILTDCEARLMD